jgi:hypothetical protein
MPERKSDIKDWKANYEKRDFNKGLAYSDYLRFGKDRR